MHAATYCHAPCVPKFRTAIGIITDEMRDVYPLLSRSAAGQGAPARVAGEGAGKAYTIPIRADGEANGPRAALYGYPARGFTREACAALSILTDGRVQGDRVLDLRFANMAAPDDAWSRKIDMLALPVVCYSRTKRYRGRPPPTASSKAWSSAGGGREDQVCPTAGGSATAPTTLGLGTLSRARGRGPAPGVAGPRFGAHFPPALPRRMRRERSRPGDWRHPPG